MPHTVPSVTRFSLVPTGLLLGTFTACGTGPLSPDASSVLLVESRTTGDSLDLDGYVLYVDEVPLSGRLPPNGRRLVSDLAPGWHEFRLGEIDGQCLYRSQSRTHSGTITAPPESVTVLLLVTCARRVSRLDDRILWETDRNGARDIYAMRPDGSDVVNVTNNGWDNVAVAVSPDGRELSYLREFPSTGGLDDYDWHLYVMSPDHTGLRRLLGWIQWEVGPIWPDPQWAPLPLQWAPDWRHLLFLEGGCSWFSFSCTTRIAVTNADGTDQRTLTEPSEAYGPRVPRWSPDGTRIAFAGKADSGLNAPQGLYLVNADGSALARAIEHDGVWWRSLTWSPDGTRLAFSADAHPDPQQPTLTYGELFVVNADGSSETQLTSGNISPTSIAWSPDGTRIAFVGLSHDSGDSYQVYVVNADGSAQRRLTSGGTAGSVVWSPDGSQLAFDYRGVDYQWDIYTMGIAASEPRNLTHDGSSNRHPIWTRPQ